MSVREFADLVGVSHTTIGRLLDTLKDQKPSLDVLGKIADATGVDICTLVTLVMDTGDVNISAEARLLADKISRLPPDSRKLVDAFIIGSIMQNLGKDT